jgi:poly(beta-D-mannuronate) lyase
MTSKLVFLLLISASPLLAADIKVSSAADIAAALPNARPGDTLVIFDGTLIDQAILFKATGAAEKPITLRAQTPGKVILIGKSSLKFDGQYLIVSGLYFKDGEGAGDAITLGGQHNRLTDCAVTAGQYKFFVHFFGQSNRMDHCYLAEKTSGDPTLQIEVAEKEPNNHLLDHNHFGHRPPLGRNGGETIRCGYSFQSMFSSKTTVENNLFERCDGEIEIISSKSCDNIYRNNTFLDCAGFLTLRHGNRCTVDGNFFLGKGRKGSGGIRVIGEDHTITNNYIADVADGVFRITSGIVDSPLNGYFQAKRCTIANNTVVDCKGAYLEIDAGIGTSRRTLRPENITIAGNIFVLPAQGAALIKGMEGQGWKWSDNLAFGPQLEGDYRGIGITDPHLKQADDGIWRKAGAPVANHPLTPKDVGPSWSDGLVRATPP